MVQTISNSNSEASQLLSSFWPKATEDIKNMIPNDFKHQELPLARIKKIMKLDEDVKMISAEAPVLFSKAAELFITELTLRAWVHTEDNKRRTLQRNDIAMAISKFDQFDFLIDIVPRDELKPSKPRDEGVSRSGATAITDQVQYYLQLAQQNQQALQQTTQQQPSVASAAPQQIQIVQPGGQIQTINVVPAAQVVQASQAAVSGAAGQQVVVQGLNLGAVQQQQQQQAQQQQQQQQQAQNQQQQLASGIQVVQQVVGPNGEVQQIPLQLTPQQLQLIRMQLGANGGQSLMLQATTGQQGSQQQLE